MVKAFSTGNIVTRVLGTFQAVDTAVDSYEVGKGMEAEWGEASLDLRFNFIIIDLICGTVCYKQFSTYLWNRYISKHSIVWLIIPPGIGGRVQIELHLLAFLCTLFMIQPQRSMCL